eukprot:m.47850 g.47850  ORF g.47850 m.47850 type:complete len:556 (+) comp6003_c0_seq3:129-1796(+)
MAAHDAHVFPVDDRGLPVIEGTDSAEVRNGFRLFFQNKPDQALAFFDQHPEIPLFALGKATLMFAQAFVSFEEEDIENAVKALQHASELIQKHAVPDDGVLKSWGKWISGSAKAKKSAQHVHYDVMLAECKLLSSCLLFLEESLLDKLKAGWSMRSAWQQYHHIEKENPRAQPDQPDHLDPETRSGIDFGVGVFNLVCSILPPRVQRIISIFGFPSDREHALRSLAAVHGSDTVRSPVGSLALLLHHVGLQSSFGMGNTTRFIAEAEAMLAHCMTLYPDGALFLLMQGRLRRLQREIRPALASYQQAADLKLKWRQLNDLISYELGWAQLLLLEVELAMKHFIDLKENRWSRGFYTYMIAACQLHLGQLDEAAKLMEEVPKLCVRKVQGRLIPSEEFATRKAKAFLDGHRAPLNVYEVLYLWNSYSQMPAEQLQQIATAMEKLLAGPPAPTRPDDIGLAHLLAAAALTQLHRFDDAAAHLDAVQQVESKIKSDTYVPHFAEYERAVIMGLRKDPLGVRRATLEKILHGPVEFNFGSRLHFRVHLAIMEIDAASRV